MKDERTRAMLTTIAVSGTAKSSNRRWERERAREGEREVMIICCVDNEQQTLNRKIEKESKKRAWVH